MLYSRLTTFKNADTPERFLEVAHEKLSQLNIAAEPSIPLSTAS